MPRRSNSRNRRKQTNQSRSRSRKSVNRTTRQRKRCSGVRFRAGTSEDVDSLPQISHNPALWTPMTHEQIAMCLLRPENATEMSTKFQSGKDSYRETRFVSDHPKLQTNWFWVDYLGYVREGGPAFYVLARPKSDTGTYVFRKLV